MTQCLPYLYQKFKGIMHLGLIDNKRNLFHLNVWQPFLFRFQKFCLKELAVDQDLIVKFKKYQSYYVLEPTSSERPPR